MHHGATRTEAQQVETDMLPVESNLSAWIAMKEPQTFDPMIPRL